MKRVSQKETACGNRRRAFTLLEMMLVVVIIGLLATVVVWNLAGAGKKGRIGAAKGQMGSMKSAITQYYAEKGSYPASLSELVPGFLDKVPKDPWKREYIYFTPSSDPNHGFELQSKGEKEEVSDDDLNIWTLDEEAETP